MSDKVPGFIATLVNNNHILNITSEGIMTWHPKAKEMLEDDAGWITDNTGMRKMLQLLFHRHETDHLVKETLTWYMDESQAIKKNLTEKRDQAVLASVNILSMDNGDRAKRAIDILEGKRTA